MLRLEAGIDVPPHALVPTVDGGWIYVVRRFVRDKVVSLSPAYDLLNTTLVLEKAEEETALPLDGKKKKLTRKLWLDYFCTELLGLPTRQLDKLLTDLARALPKWHDLIDRSHLPEAKKEVYHDLLKEQGSYTRGKEIFLTTDYADFTD